MSDIPTYTYKQVLTAVEKLFRGKEKEAHDVLSAFPPAWETGREETGISRVRLAIIKLSQGDMERLKHFADVAAKQDWRDVLLWAEYENAGEGIPSVATPSVQIKEPYKELL